MRVVCTYNYMYFFNLELSIYNILKLSKFTKACNISFKTFMVFRYVSNIHCFLVSHNVYESATCFALL